MYILSFKPGLIERLAEPKDSAINKGVFEVKLNVTGVWTELIVDDYFPLWIQRNDKKER